MVQHRLLINTKLSCWWRRPDICLSCFVNKYWIALIAIPVSSEGRDWLQLRCNALRPDTTGVTGIVLVRTLQGCQGPGGLGAFNPPEGWKPTQLPPRVGRVFSRMTPWKWLPCNRVHWPRVHDAICTEMPRHLQSSSSTESDQRYHSFLSAGLQVSQWLGSPAWVTLDTTSVV